jgi:hypothetical protein
VTVRVMTIGMIVGLLLVVLVLNQMPDIQRYLKMRSM